MEEMVLQFFLTHGWKLTLLSCSGIFFLGVLKYFDLFRRLEASKKKVVYAIISACFSIAVCGIYLAATDKFTWLGFGILSAGVFGVNQSVYAVYENCGIRTLVKRLGTLFINFVAKKQLGIVKSSVVGQDVVNDLENDIEADTVESSDSASK